MVTKVFSVIQPMAVPKGTPEFEEKRAALLQALEKTFPLEFYLPEHIIKNPPKDVSTVPKTCGLLSPEELDITENYDAFGLAEAIAARKYTAVTVAKAFAKRAVIAHQLTCCLTQFFMDKAIEQASKLDEYLAKNGKPIGPLHGVPVSIKEHMPIAGTYSSEGKFSTIVYDEDDSQLVSILRRAGAVFYCKTNQPQAIMHLETDSFWGRTLCPYNINLSSGGSTGGEAALIAMKGSVLGIGTDIGGSIRGPSAFCGIYGYKPTSYVLPMKGMLKAPFSAELNVICAIGPMCRTLRDVEFCTSVLLNAKPHLEDPRLIPLPWTGLKTQLAGPRRLKIGITENDGFIEPQPPVKRAVAWARKLLSDPKYSDILEIKEFKPHGAAEAWSKIRRMYWPDGGEGPKAAITASGEPIYPLTTWILKEAEAGGMKNSTDVAYMRQERDNFRIEFLEKWNAQDVDVVIGPCFVGPACAHETGFYWTYTSLYNFVDYPGVVFPTPIKAEAGEKYASDYSPLSDACKHVKQLWEETNFEGAPINLQINARKYHDNQLFGALAVVKDILNLP